MNKIKVRAIQFKKSNVSEILEFYDTITSDVAKCYNDIEAGFITLYISGVYAKNFTTSIFLFKNDWLVEENGKFIKMSDRDFNERYTTESREYIIPSCFHDTGTMFQFIGKRAMVVSFMGRWTNFALIKLCGTNCKIEDIIIDDSGIPTITQFTLRLFGKQKAFY